MIRLHTLGPVTIAGPGAEDPPALLSQPKRLALLTYLALPTPGTLHRRDTLVGLLWPELDDHHARAALRKALFDLRTELGPHVLNGDRAEGIGFEPDTLWCDVATFDEAVSQRQYRAAMDVYGGDFLSGVFLSDAPAFERWMEVERTRLRERAAAAAWALAEEEAGAGCASDARRWAHKALELAPDDEPLVGRVIVLLDQSGDRAGAIAAYEAFSSRVRVEYDAEPAPETRALIHAVRSRNLPNGPAVATNASQAPIGDNRGGSNATTGNTPVAPGREPPAAWFVPRGRLARVAGLIAAGTLAASLIAMAAAKVMSAGAATELPKSIAVLPFRDLDGADRQFTEELTEDVATLLSQIHALRVLSVETVRQLGEGRQSIENIRPLLGASALVRGTVRHDGGRVRIAVRLVDTRTQRDRWAEAYDRQTSDAFSLEGPMVASITRALGVRLSEAEQDLVRQPPSTVKASVLWRNAVAGWNHGEWRGSEVLARRAIALDSSFGPAYGYLAAEYQRRFWLDRNAALHDSALASIGKAVSLSPNHYYVYHVRAFAGLCDWPGDCLADYLKATELNPTYASTANNIGSLYARIGRFDQAFRWYGRLSSLLLDSTPAYQRWAKMYFNLGDYRAAESLFERARALRGLNWQNAVERVGSYLASGRFEVARIELADLPREMDGDSLEYLGMAGFVELYAGEYQRAKQYLEKSARPADRVGSGQEFLPLTGLGYAYWKLGDSSRAQSFLAKALAQDQTDLGQDLQTGDVQAARAAAYDIARIRTIQSNRVDAVRWLKIALQSGHYPSMYTHLGPGDPMLASLRGDAGFEGLMAAERARLDQQRERVARMHLPPNQDDINQMMEQGRRDVDQLRKDWRQWAATLPRPLARR